MMATAAQLQPQHSKELNTNVMNNDDNNIAAAATSTTTAAAPETATTVTTTAPLADATGRLSTTSASIEKSLATMELQYFKAVSLYRRRNYEKCVEVCNVMLQAGHENNVQMFNTPPDEEEENINAAPVGGSGGGSEEMLLLNNKFVSSGSGSGAGTAAMSNNSSTQRYSSNLQRMTVRQGGRQRGIYGNNVSSATAASSTASAINSVTNFSTSSSSSLSSSSTAFGSIMPTWMMEGVWQLKMRALTQRIYIDDLETNDAEDAGK